MAEYRKGHKVNPKTGLTKPEERAGLTRAEAEAHAEAGSASAPSVSEGTGLTEDFESHAESSQVESVQATDTESTVAGPEGPQPSMRPDIASAKARMSAKFGGGRELKKLDEYLWEDETVSRMATGTYAGKNGLLVLTDRRLIFLFHGWASQRNEDFTLDTITSVSASSGLALASLTVFSGGAKAEIKNVSKADAKTLADEIRNRLATRGTPQPVATSQAATPDVLAQLKQLGELREAGVLTTEEFEAKKAELLRRL